MNSPKPLPPDPKKEAIARAAEKVIPSARKDITEPLGKKPKGPNPSGGTTKKPPVQEAPRDSLGAAIIGYLLATALTLMFMISTWGGSGGYINSVLASIDLRALWVPVSTTLPALCAYILLRLIRRFGLWQIVLATIAVNAIVTLFDPWDAIYDRSQTLGRAVLSVCAAVIIWYVIRASKRVKPTNTRPQHRPDLNRVIAGFLLPALVISIAMGILSGSLLAGFMYLIFTSGFAVVLGLPAYLFYRWMGWLSLWQTMFAGAILGFLAAIILPSILGPSTSSSAFASCMALGAVVAGIFWLIVVRPSSLENHK